MTYGSEPSLGERRKRLWGGKEAGIQLSWGSRCHQLRVPLERITAAELKLTVETIAVRLVSSTDSLALWPSVWHITSSRLYQRQQQRQSSMRSLI